MIQLQDNNENNHNDVQFCNKTNLDNNFKIIYNDENLINEEEVHQKELEDVQIHAVLIEFY